MKNITIVTCLFDLDRGSLQSFWKRDFSQYLEWFKGVLAIDAPMVIYCEPSLDEFIATHRSHPSTEIIHMSLDEFRTLWYYKLVQEIRTSEKWLNFNKSNDWLRWSPQGRLELYNMVVMFKQFMMNETAIKNTFKTDYFLWVDAGIGNTTDTSLFNHENLEKNLTPYLEKMLYLIFRFRGPEVHGFDIAELDRYAGTEVNHLARATLFGGSREAIIDMTPIYTLLLHSTLNEGNMGTEENIFTLITILFPKKVKTYQLDERNPIVEEFLKAVINE